MCLALTIALAVTNHTPAHTQRLMANMEAANVAMVLKQLSILQPTAAYTSCFAQYRQLPLLLSEVLVRLGDK